MDSSTTHFDQVTKSASNSGESSCTWPGLGLTPAYISSLPYYIRWHLKLNELFVIQLLPVLMNLPVHVLQLLAVHVLQLLLIHVHQLLLNLGHDFLDGESHIQNCVFRRSASEVRKELIH